jgi:hypothetical protein
LLFGGVRILVPAPQREIAREILKEIGAGGSLADDAE